VVGITLDGRKLTISVTNYFRWGIIRAEFSALIAATQWDKGAQLAAFALPASAASWRALARAQLGAARPAVE
jgi:hypothetical protein